MQRAAEQASRAQARAAKEMERLQRQRERERIANEKEKARLFDEQQQEEAESRNRDLAETIRQISNLLSDGIGLDYRLNFEKLKTPLKLPEFTAGSLVQAEEPPKLQDFLPKPPSMLARLLPRLRARYQRALIQARARYDAEVAAHGEREKARNSSLQAAQREHQQTVGNIKEKMARQHAEVDALRFNYEAGNKEGVRQYCETVLSSLSNPDGWPDLFRIAFVPESKQIVLEYQFPGFEIVPEVASYEYVRSKKEISVRYRKSARADSERRRLYSTTIAQATLRVLHVLFNADYAGHVESIVFNGHVIAIDPATGHEVHPCLVTLRTTRALFSELDLTRVDAEECPKGLNASVSKRPTDLAPVKPVLEFNMVDPRFVQEEEILSGLDNRTNLMDLNPREFESLITNLFTKMGLETRQTRPSRDGGVDCVAYDPRPIFGGKVVIQAKRYKNTVGVSAIRDLYGTVQNEGASKGILVTTSGFGRASFEFANGKPLELLNGSNLLYLLAEHAGIEAKIEVPEDWKDPSPDLGE